MASSEREQIPLHLEVLGGGGEEEEEEIGGGEAEEGEEAAQAEDGGEMSRQGLAGAVWELTVQAVAHSQELELAGAVPMECQVGNREMSVNLTH